MAEEELDPDLQVLMSELEKVEGEVVASVKEEPKPESKPEEPKLAEVILEEPKLEEPKKELKILETEQQPSEFDLKKAQIQNKLIGLIDVHCDSAVKIIEDVEADRNKCDDVYNILFAKLQANDYRASDTMAIVATLQTKADITKTRANMMDSVAKLLASLKNNNTVNTGEGAGSGDLSPEEVKKLLER
jgi:hypothetical protein